MIHDAAAITVPAVFATLYAAHQVGDIWVQTHRQACDKASRTSVGVRACLAHVTTLTATKLLFLLLLWVATGLPFNPFTLILGLTLDAVTHYWADRRYTLQRLTERLGKTDFYKLGLPDAAPCGTGAYVLDQSWHVGWLFITSLIVAAGA